MGCGVPISPQCRSATDELGDVARAENWRNPGGRELFGASWKGEGPLPLTGVAPQSQPLQGMLLRRSTDICPK
jgi:hypothetical protein